MGIHDVFGNRGILVRFKCFYHRHPFWSIWALDAILGGGLLILLFIVSVYDHDLKANPADLVYYDLLPMIMICFLLCLFYIYPCLLTIRNVVILQRLPQTNRDKKVMRIYDGITIGLGISYSLIYESLMEPYIMKAQWWQRLRGIQLHQPVWTESWLTIAVLSMAGILGYLLLTFVPLHKLPPLLTVSGMAGMYLGITQCIFWCIQVSENDIVLCVFPVNCILIALHMIRLKIREWREMQQEEMILDSFEAEREKVCTASDRSLWYRLLYNAAFWPLLAFLFMWPLLGLLLILLVLLGQHPDAALKAWTETADWRLSTQTAPPNVVIDEHYLCTVAAGGHAKLVKPLRMGERHGHLVVVNRQLCIANAFEQILEERTPGFHRVVRRFYDTYGFPVARLIHTRLAADVVYIIMKPLEWIFLMVLYLCDAKPENRIAVQYLPRA